MLIKEKILTDKKNSKEFLMKKKGLKDLKKILSDDYK